MAEDSEVPLNTEENPQESPNPTGGEALLRKKKTRQVLRLGIIGGAVVILAIMGWLAFRHFSASEAKPETNDEGIGEIAPKDNYFMSVPEIIVNLRSNGGKGNILRATFVMQLYSREDETKIKDCLPIIVDRFLSYLRDQSVADFEGSGLERARQALLIRVNNAIRPLKIFRVVIKDFIIQ